MFVRVEPLEDAADLLRHLLKLQGRCATAEQTFRIVEAVNSSDQTQTPLLVTILAQWVSQWHSYDDLSRVTIPISVRDVIVGLFKRMEKKHGEKLVQAALPCLHHPGEAGGIGDRAAGAALTRRQGPRRRL